MAANFHTCGGRRRHSRGTFPPPECLSEAARWRRTTATADRIPGSPGRIDAAQLPLVSPARPLPTLPNAPPTSNSSVLTFLSQPHPLPVYLVLLHLPRLTLAAALSLQNIIWPPSNSCNKLIPLSFSVRLVKAKCIHIHIYYIYICER